jgi:hypothetical protein
MNLDAQTAQIVLDALWNRLHHNAWETHRVTHSIGNHSPKNPYLPRPALATIPKCKALDTSDTIFESARILTTAWPEEHPHLTQAIAIEWTKAAHQTWLNNLTNEQAATFTAAIETWPHAYEYKTNRHGTRRYRAVADDEAITIGLSLVPLANVRPFDPADLEPAYISEGDLLELERIAGVSTPPTKRVPHADNAVLLRP